MAREAGFLLDAMLVILLAVLVYVALRKFVFPVGKKTFFDGARDLLSQKIDLKEQQESLKKQFVLGELDSKHYRTALNHNLQELALIERKLKRLGFA